MRPPALTQRHLFAAAAAAVLLAWFAQGVAASHGDVAAQFLGQRRFPVVESRIEPVPAARLELLERWLKAVARHTPGEEDDALVEAGSWSNGELQALWVDINALVQLTRKPTLAKFIVRTGPRGPVEIGYTEPQLQRLTALRCAATGDLALPHCLSIKAESQQARSEALRPFVDPDFQRLSISAGAAKLHGDDNYVLRRGAMLHLDVATLLPPSAADRSATSSSTGPQRLRVEISDGRETDLRETGVHWEIARMVLDYVKPSGADRPAPGHDEMVRRWYRATAAWMQHRETHDTVHLARAREIFPADPDILFLSGCQRETYAGPPIQSVARSVVLPTGFVLAVGAERAELHEAETLYRRALELKPDLGEAHLRLGRVLARLGRHHDALNELRKAVASTDEELLQYYGRLFLGAEEEALGNYDAAQGAYERAAALYPSAQSPLLALSQLARRRGDRTAALRALQQVFDLPSAGDRDDPWWTYYVAQARNAVQLLEDLRRPFVDENDR